MKLRHIIIFASQRDILRLVVWALNFPLLEIMICRSIESRMK